MKRVSVTWIDAIGGGDDWISLEDLKKEKPHIHYSMGFLAHETEECITISMSYDAEEQNMGGWLCIPRPYIVKIEELVLQ